MNHLVRLGTVFVSLVLAVSTAAGQASKGGDTESGEKVYQRTLRSTVWVLIPTDGRRARMGTGSLIDTHRQPLILTNYHVVGDKDQALVYFPIFQKGQLVAERTAYQRAKPIRGEVVLRDSKRDLALIRLEALPPDAKPLKLAKRSPSPGQRIHSIGNPGASGALWVYTPGSVRQVYHKKFMTGRDGEGTMEVDARIVETASSVNQGDSGGPVVNDSGELVAVVQGHLEEAKARAYSIFIDVTEVRDLLTTSGKHLARLPPPEEEKPKEVQSTSDKTSEKSEEDPAVKKERDAARQLKYVKEFIADGKKNLARKHCDDIITRFPNTKAAKEAKQLLEKLE